MKRYRLWIAIMLAAALSGCIQTVATERKTMADPFDAVTETGPDAPGNLSESEAVPHGNEAETPSPTSIEPLPEESLLASMTLEEKIGQLLVIGYSSDQSSAWLNQWIQEYKVGGIVLFSRNYRDFSDLHALTQLLRSLNAQNPVPLFIAVDEEGGTVSRLPEGKTKIPSARVMGELNDPILTMQSGRVIGRELSAAGANMNFAPVLDIVENPENQLLLHRSYGAAADLVSAHGLAFMEGLRQAGVLSVAKHFPGHGDTTVDSHKELPTILIDEETWWQREAVPYVDAIQQGLDAIMVGHLSFPLIDPSGLPASQSEVFLRTILRDKMGFEGVVLTDDIEMLGYPQGDALGEAVVHSFLAGIDLFAIGHTPQVQLAVLDALKGAVDTGVISLNRLDESVLRILRLKSGIRENKEYALEEALAVFGAQEHQEILRQILEAE